MWTFSSPPDPKSMPGVNKAINNTPHVGNEMLSCMDIGIEIINISN
jgi:hypothetical protein